MLAEAILIVPAAFVNSVPSVVVVCAVTCPDAFTVKAETMPFVEVSVEDVGLTAVIATELPVTVIPVPPVTVPAPEN